VPLARRHPKVARWVGSARRTRERRIQEPSKACRDRLLVAKYAWDQRADVRIAPLLGLIEPPLARANPLVPAHRNTKALPPEAERAFITKLQAGVAQPCSAPRIASGLVDPPGPESRFLLWLDCQPAR